MALHEKLEIFDKRQSNYEILNRQKFKKTKQQKSPYKSNFELTVYIDIYKNT